MSNSGEIEIGWWSAGRSPSPLCARRELVSFSRALSSARIYSLLRRIRSGRGRPHLLFLGLLLFPALGGYAADLIAVVDAAGAGGDCGVARGDGNNPWGGVVPSTNPLGHNLGIVWLGTGKVVQGALGGLVPGPDTASCNDGTDPFMAIRPAACSVTSTCGESGISSESKQWMIHFQGGGACKDGVECWECSRPLSNGLGAQLLRTAPTGNWRHRRPPPDSTTSRSERAVRCQLQRAVRRRAPALVVYFRSPATRGPAGCNDSSAVGVGRRGDRPRWGGRLTGRIVPIRVRDADFDRTTSRSRT